MCSDKGNAHLMQLLLCVLQDTCMMQGTSAQVRDLAKKMKQSLTCAPKKTQGIESQGHTNKSVVPKQQRPQTATQQTCGQITSHRLPSLK